MRALTPLALLAFLALAAPSMAAQQPATPLPPSSGAPTGHAT